MTSRPPELEREDAVIRPGPFTVADLDAMPVDGYRRELFDGVLVMSPSPRARHQDITGQLFIALSAAVSPELKVWIAPFSVRREPGTSIEPDLVVTRRSDVTGELAVVARPALAVEVASPSTRAYDLGAKKDFLAEVGCPSYWTIEPDRGPELTVWTLTDRGYVRETIVTGSQSWTARLPFPVTVVPADLVDP